MPRGQDVLRSVHVCVVGMAAGQADEAALGLPVGALGVAAGRTALTRERRIHRDHLAPDRCGLVLQLAPELAPCRIQDAAVQPRLLAHPRARLVCRAPGAGAHGRDPEVFDRNHWMAGHY